MPHASHDWEMSEQIASQEQRPNELVAARNGRGQFVPHILSVQKLSATTYTTVEADTEICQDLRAGLPM